MQWEKARKKGKNEVALIENIGKCAAQIESKRETFSSMGSLKSCLMSLFGSGGAV